MKNILRPLGAALAGISAALLVSSCYYDPYYSSTSISGSYSDNGYGYGYGYGSSRFSTSFFVSTGNPNWGYDPYCQSYYDYSRRAYYDPYLYGYYPVGYRPPILVGCPHPYGYRPGRYCPPPRVIHYNTVPNYRNREHAYRASNYDWARQVRTKPIVNRPEETRPPVRPGNQGWNQSRPSDSKYHGRTSNSRNPQPYSRPPQTSSRTQETKPSRTRPTYVNQRQEESRGTSTRNNTHRTDTRANTRTTPKPQTSPPPRNQRTEESRQEKEKRQEESRKIRSLGQSQR